MTSASFHSNTYLDDFIAQDLAAISGTVTQGGSAVEGAKVYAIDATNGAYIGSDTTDASGDYSVGGCTPGSYHHVAAEWNDGGTLYNSESQPFIVP